MRNIHSLTKVKKSERKIGSVPNTFVSVQNHLEDILETHISRTKEKKIEEDLKFQSTFGLSKDQIIVKQYEWYFYFLCFIFVNLPTAFSSSFRGPVNLYGKFYVSQDHICYISRVFYKKFKLVHKFSEVVDIKSVKEELVITTKKKKVLKFFGFSGKLEEIFDILTSLSKFSNQKKFILNTISNTPSLITTKNSNLVMEKGDWEILLSGAQISSFSANEIIVCEGDSLHSIYKVFI